jgi:hypothetical protein
MSGNQISTESPATTAPSPASSRSRRFIAKLLTRGAIGMGGMRGMDEVWPRYEAARKSFAIKYGGMAYRGGGGTPQKMRANRCGPSPSVPSPLVPAPHTARNQSTGWRIGKLRMISGVFGTAGSVRHSAMNFGSRYARPANSRLGCRLGRSSKYSTSCG